jgi:hypothetical protein
VFEKVNREIPFDGLHWMFDHAETISPKNIDRVRARRRARLEEVVEVGCRKHQHLPAPLWR